jgi:hypothetical protein
MVAPPTTSLSWNTNTPLVAGPASNMTNDQLQDTWQAVERQAQNLPSNQREQSEDAALMQGYRTGQIDAQDLDTLLTKAADQNPQVDPGKEAVANLEAQGVKLTGQQKNAIEQSARNEAAQAKVANAESLLNLERSAPGQDPSQALSIGITTFDANGNQQHLLVRNTGPGANSIQQISDLGDGFSDQVLIDNAEDQLEAQMAATPADQRKTLSEKVHAPGGTFDVSLDTNGKLNVTKEQGFWGSLLHVVEAVAPIALAAIPGVGPIASAAYLGVTGGADIANGNVVGGIADIAGGMAGVGGLIGGVTGSAIQDAATVTQYGDQAYSAANTDNVLGVINAAAGAVPDMASDLGVSNDFVNTAQTVAGEIGTVGQAGQAALNAINSGNIFGGVSSFAALAPATLGVFGNDASNFVSSLQPSLTQIAQLGQTVQSTVTAAQQGNVVGAIEAAAQGVGIDQDFSDD